MFTGVFAGTEPATPVGLQSGPFFDFNGAVIRQLLARNGAVGVRFHFDQARPNFPTELYAAACGPINDIKDRAAVSQDFFLKNGQGVAFENLPPTVAANYKAGNKVGACVFFSRTILEGNILGTELAPTAAVKIRFFVRDFGVLDNRSIPCFTLVAVGLDSTGALVGPFLMSEQPCPPNCPSDPDSPYGLT